MNRLEQKDREIEWRQKGQVPLVMTEACFKDVPKEEREECTQFFKKIWVAPIVHKSRSAPNIVAFFQELIRRSYLAHKSGTYIKHVVKYGDHYRQKFSIYTSKQKLSVPPPVVVFIHGGYFINGTEEGFEYMGKGFVERGYVLVTMGFRQLPQTHFPDIFDDGHRGFQQLLRVAPKYDLDTNNIIYLSWSGGGMMALTNFFRYRDLYQKHVKLHVSLASPWQKGGTYDQKVAQALVDDPKQIHDMFPYAYLGPKLSIPIIMLIGTQDKEFPQAYEQNIKYFKIYKGAGLDVTLVQLENHNHYDLVLNVDVGLTKIREFEIKRIDPYNELSKLLFMADPKIKDQMYELLKDPIWKIDFSVPLNEGRLRTIDRYRAVNNLIGRNEHSENYPKMFAMYELFGFADPSAATKTIAHSSCVTSVSFLGTEKHQYLLDLVAEGKIVFAFCLTEAGGGNNLAQSGNLATYDEKTKEFIFHTPTQFSKKFWCAGLGMHANYALVFAKLIVKNKNEGTHAFVIRIRDEKHQPLPGIILEDIGQKATLNGIDNGTLRFENVRVPKDALLNRTADIDDQGNYSCPIKNTSQRFFAAIDRLLAGRLAISSIGSGIIKAVCIIGATFSRYRFGVSETGQTNIPIGNFQLQQNDVIPVISRSLVLLFFHHYTKEVFCYDQKNIELSNLCNINKIFCTEHMLKGATTIRERCGSQGMLGVNGLGEYILVANGACTGEGDNKVLIMKVAKDNLKLIGSGKLSLPISKISKITSVDQLKDLDTLLGLLQKREAALFTNLTNRIIQLKGQRKQPYQMFLKYLWEQMKAYSYAYGERLAFENGTKTYRRLKEPEHVYELGLHFVIHALDYLRQNIGFYAYEEIIPADVAKEMGLLRSRLIKDAARRVQILVHKLNLPEHVMTFPIAKPDYLSHFYDLPRNSQIPSHL